MFDLHAPQPKALDKLLSLQGKTAVITGGSRGIGTVSYTHLDVYKRQL